MIYSSQYFVSNFFKLKEIKRNNYIWNSNVIKVLLKIIIIFKLDYYYFKNMYLKNMESSIAIWFYKSNEKHGYMSNFYKCKFTDQNGIQYNCSEQYFMYMKCLMFDPDNKILLGLILNEINPAKIKLYGREVKNFHQIIWNEHKYNIMCDAIHKKFSQNKHLQEKLYATKGKLLYEAAKNDRIWGIGYTATESRNVDHKYYGENLLGKALMRYRDSDPEYVPIESERYINQLKKINFSLFN